jgi:hypothetical protein
MHVARTNNSSCASARGGASEAACSDCRRCPRTWHVPVIIDPRDLLYSSDSLNILIIVLYRKRFKLFAAFSGNRKRRARPSACTGPRPYENADLHFSTSDSVCLVASSSRGGMGLTLRTPAADLL